MQKIKVSLFTLVFLVSLSITLQVSGDSRISFTSEASADTFGPCASNGYKIWNGGVTGPQAKDCWCDNIRKPILVCDTSQTGEN